MKTLVTGASGFIGSAVLRKLIERGHEARALVRPTSDPRNLDGLDVEVVEGDLLQPATLERAVDGCSALFHVAADYRLWVPRPEEIYATNVGGTRDLLRAAARAGVKRIVYTSSVATLGLHQGGAPADETTPVQLEHMIGHYKRSKFLAEEEVRRLSAAEGIPVVIVNPAAPMGPRDVKPTPTGRMVLDAARGRMPAYVDTGLNVVHVDDVAAGHVLAFERGAVGERYILGAANMTLKEILTEVSAIAGRRPPRLCLPHNLVLPVAWAAEGWARLRGREPLIAADGVRLARKRMFFSSEKARRELGYEARPAVEALRDAVAWFRGAGYLR
jgi:dihydroflavonol-4-reductase